MIKKFFFMNSAVYSLSMIHMVQNYFAVNNGVQGMVYM